MIVDDYALGGCHRAIDEFRACADIDSPLVEFLGAYPEDMRTFGRRGKVYWVKTAAVTPDVRARPCYALKYSRGKIIKTHTQCSNHIIAWSRTHPPTATLHERLCLIRNKRI